ncbi:MAG TPA: UDP-N-acetylglucosamine--N-acetylmuramyl-(pentapeptide) pyrophosphoryl-undecaprenol N-acetylglucosamine transferase [Candidatus Omnitrophota bacterium]|nr:UDP-N-acetylglucosamine--N-acetylmuramyl-(pentapeptide) pyrophosphoryl-undecaprenol N-acetylglucosamine transferase [Candidatus Omnitrophota bacterium]
MRTLLFAGPSGGHLFPALAFAQAFHREHPDSLCFLVTTPRVEGFLEGWTSHEWLRFFYLSELPSHRVFSLKFLRFLLKFCGTFFRSGKILDEVRPDVIVSFGTLISVPGVFWGRMKKIPVVLHEQNAVLGRANAALVPFAKKVAVSFPSTIGRLPRGKGFLSGNILRDEILAGRARRRTSSGKMRVLILGGSQGASSLNRTVFDVFCLFTREERAKFAVFHITGKKDFPYFEKAYRDLDLRHEIFSFTDRMNELYAESDLVIGRAGGGALAEIFLYGLPSILIPYPYAASHQLENAKYAADEGAAILVEQKKLTAERLKEILTALLSEPGKMSALASNAKRLAIPDAAGRLVREVEQLVSGQSG